MFVVYCVVHIVDFTVVCLLLCMLVFDFAHSLVAHGSHGIVAVSVTVTIGAQSWVWIGSWCAGLRVSLGRGHGGHRGGVSRAISFAVWCWWWCVPPSHSRTRQAPLWITQRAARRGRAVIVSCWWERPPGGGGKMSGGLSMNGLGKLWCYEHSEGSVGNRELALVTLDGSGLLL